MLTRQRQLIQSSQDSERESVDHDDLPSLPPTSDEEQSGSLGEEQRKTRQPRRRIRAYRDNKRLQTSDIPPFTPKDIATWTTKVDFLFSLYEEKDKYYRFKLVGPLLPISITKKLTRPFSENSYDEMFQLLQDSYAPSAKERAQVLFRTKLQPDEKPSEYLEKIQSSLGSSVWEAMITDDLEFVKELFLRALPPTVVPILKIMSRGANLDIMVECADYIIENNAQAALSMPSYGSVNLIPAKQHNFRESSSSRSEILSEVKCVTKEQNKMSSQISEILQKLTHLADRVSDIENKITNNNRNKGGDERNWSRARSPSPASYNPNGPLCYYHFTYREDAHRCQRGTCRMAYLMDRSGQGSRRNSQQRPSNSNTPNNSISEAGNA